MDLATALRIQSQAVRPGASVLLGWVQSWTSTAVTVLLDDDADPVAVPKLRRYTPESGEVALIVKAGGSMYAIGALNAGAVTRPDPDDGDQPPPPNPIITKTIRPNFTGTWRGNGWRSDSQDVLQGDWTGKGTNWGAAYYGRGVSSITGTAVSGTVRIRRARGGNTSAAVRPELRLLLGNSRGGTQPRSDVAPLTGPALRIEASATVALPVWWVQNLIDGSHGGLGIGTETAPYVGLLGRAWWAPSFELTIKFRRTS